MPSPSTKRSGKQIEPQVEPSATGMTEVEFRAAFMKAFRRAKAELHFPTRQRTPRPENPTSLQRTELEPGYYRELGIDDKFVPLAERALPPGGRRYLKD